MVLGIPATGLSSKQFIERSFMMVTPEILEQIFQRSVDKMVSEKLFAIGRDLYEITKGMNLSDSDNEEVRIFFIKTGRIACEKFFNKLEERNQSKKN